MFLFIIAVGGDGPHDEAALYRADTAQATVAALEFLADEAIGGAAESWATGAVDIGAEEAEGAQFGDQFEGEGAGLEVFAHDGEEFPIDKIADRVADAAFLVAEVARELVEVSAWRRGHFYACLF